MKLHEIAEHTIDIDTLRGDWPNVIIDIGCLGFRFSNHFLERGDIVYSIDIQKLEGDYDRIAITDYIGEVGIKVGSDPQATMITTKPGGWEQVPCTTLEVYMESKGIELADVIKIDCEGSEYEIIKSLTKAPARQLSIEFHLHTGAYSSSEVAYMVEKLTALGYKQIQHVYEARHGAGFNFWDSLFVLE